MSLINEMLRDLETRGEQGDAAPGVRPPMERRPHRTQLLVGVLAVLVGALAAALAFLLWPKPQAATVAAATVEAPVTGEAPAHGARPETGSQSPPAAAEVRATPAPAPAASAGEPDETAAEALGAERLAPVERRTEENKAGEQPTQAAAVQAGEPEIQVEAKAAPEAEGTLIVRRHQPTAEEKLARAGRDGFAALQRNDWTAAARLLSEVVSAEPANDDAREGLAVALSRQGRISEADAVLLDGLAVADVPARFAKLRARLQAARGELHAALDTLSIAVPSAAADPEYHALKAALAQQAGEYETALAEYSELTAFEPANGKWHAGLGMALDGLKRPGEARLAYRRAAQAGGLDPALAQHVRQRLAALDGQQTE